MKNSLGIYFGPEIISIVELQKNKILTNIQAPGFGPEDSSSEDKVPGELKLATFLREVFRKNKIETKDVCISLSGADLIIRTFEMPVLPVRERETAISFEARKYIPFKIEDVVSAFRTYQDKAGRKQLVLFAGIKKETFRKYLSVFKQLNITVRSIEYSAFTLLKLLELSGVKTKDLFAVLNIGAEERDYADFMVIENGFPLFSRDIKLALDSRESQPGVIAGKLTTELRLSLDYYKRKFPARGFKELYFIGDVDYQTDIQTYIQEANLLFKPVYPQKIIKGIPANLCFLKAYCTALQEAVKICPAVNILSVWEKSESKLAGRTAAMKFSPASIFSNIKISPVPLLLSGLILGLVFGLGSFQKAPLKKELAGIAEARSAIQGSGMSPQSDYNNLEQLKSGYLNKIKIVGKIIKGQFYWTPVLTEIAKIMPEGMWLNNLSLINESKILQWTLEGMIYLEDKNKQMEVVNHFFLLLQKSPVISRDFKQITLDEISATDVNKKTVTRFVMSARGIRERK